MRKPGNAKEIDKAMADLRDAGEALTKSRDEAWSRIQAAWATFGEAVTQAIESTDESRENYNLALSAAHDVVNDGVEDMEAWMSEKSEKWQEGKAGEEVSSALEGMRELANTYTEVGEFTLTNLPEIDTQGVPDLEENDVWTLDTEIVEADTTFDDAGGVL